MFKVVFLTVIVGVTIIWTARANNYANESECKEDIEQELREYVKLDSWQQLFMHHFKFILNETGDITSGIKRLKFNTIIHNVCIIYIYFYQIHKLFPHVYKSVKEIFVRIHSNNIYLFQALYGCNHQRDDEVDDCPNIYHGSIKSCHRGKNLRSAMFRSARCNFAESSLKHIVLSDALLNAYPSDKVIISININYIRKLLIYNFFFI